MKLWKWLLVGSACTVAMVTAGAQQQAELIIRNGLIVNADGRIYGGRQDPRRAGGRDRHRA